MVEIVDPKKTETVLDPACGTAGFLISSYKHILRANVDANGNSTLTPDEKGRLARNFKGYDISPDMVRLSLVNLYLHGFTDPHIYEYDTLTSEERWNEFVDVILANPPFMSPKGGIKPHRRFSIQAKRSEVLFVDYMAEHLTPTGRTGIIVPEGIIFQSQGAYKDLRKMLVENSLVAVVSLPSGCFNPYSGVKTSILILDKSIAHQSDSIGFFKIEKDGYGLGAQRRPICSDKGDKPELCPIHSDLPQVKAEIVSYLQALRSHKPTADLQFAFGLLVPREKLAASGDYNLSGDRYREADDTNHLFPQVELGSICKPEYGFTASAEDTGDTRLVRITDIAPDGRIRKDDPKFIKLTRESEPFLLKKGDLLVARTGATFGKTMLFDEAYQAVFASYLIRLRFPQNNILPEFYWSFAQSDRYWEQARNLATGGGQPQFNGSALTQIRIPLPPLEVQKEIVAEIDGYHKVIAGAHAVLDNYRPNIPIHPDWPTVPLKDVCVIKSGGTPDRSNDAFWNGDIPWVTTMLIDYGVIDRANEFITQEGLNNSSTWIVPKGTVLMAMYGQGVTRGRVAVLGIDAAINQACAAFQIRDGLLEPRYLFRVLQSRYEDLRRISDARGGNQSNLNAQVLKEYSIPLPPLPTQQAIVAEIEAEQALVDANRELIDRFEKKIQATFARVWGEEESASQEA
jgi:type I restriction enzyme M protein